MSAKMIKNKSLVGKVQIYKDINGGDYPWIVQEPDDSCWSFATWNQAIIFANGITYCPSF